MSIAHLTSPRTDSYAGAPAAAASALAASALAASALAASAPVIPAPAATVPAATVPAAFAPVIPALAATAPAASAPAAPAPASSERAATAPAHIRAVPAGTEARGFVLYVGVDEEKAEADGTSLGSIVSQIRALVAQLSPSSETYAAVALAPRGSGGRDVDVVRLALQDPAALARHRQSTDAEVDPADRARDGVVIDLSRKRLLLDNESANLTYKEFELLQYLVLREGRTIERAELIASLWGSGSAAGSNSGPGEDDSDEVPNERTIDVHVRRLRAKLGDYEDIVRTVRGVGYRFDRHADVSVRQTSTPSPDLI